jgi:hypothetical protein
MPCPWPENFYHAANRKLGKAFAFRPHTTIAMKSVPFVLAALAFVDGMRFYGVRSFL